VKGPGGSFEKCERAQILIVEEGSSVGIVKE